MPIIMFPSIGYHSRFGYYFSLANVEKIIPYIEPGKSVELYLLEVWSDEGKLIRRFRPFVRLQSLIGEHYEGYIVKHVSLPYDLTSKYNILDGYRVNVILTKYSDTLLLPYELKPIDEESRKLAEKLQDFKIDILLSSTHIPIISRTVEYILESIFRLEDGDLIGSRISLRNSLKILEEELIPRIEYSSLEVGVHMKKLKNIISNLRRFTSIKKPYIEIPGTTKTAITLAAHIIKYINENIERGVIRLTTQESKKA
ncbi:MAG: hypothetical protein QXJ65_03195 [Acidilobaceae archaeon]